MKNPFTNEILKPLHEQLNIVLVDDEPFNMLALKLILNSFGYTRIYKCFNGQDATNLIKESIILIHSVFETRTGRHRVPRHQYARPQRISNNRPHQVLGWKGWTQSSLHCGMHCLQRWENKKVMVSLILIVMNMEWMLSLENQSIKLNYFLLLHTFKKNKEKLLVENI